MPKTYYRTGQVAERWGVSQYHVRRLLEEGLVKGNPTLSGQWVIPISEIERIEEEGVPPIPSSLKTEEEEIDPQENPRHVLLAPPSSKAISSTERVLFARNRLDELRIARDIDEVKDDRSLRRQQKAEKKAAELAEIERRETAQRQAEAHAQERLRRKQWHDNWISVANKLTPADAPPQSKLDVRQCVDEVLGELDPSEPTAATLHLVNAAVQKALEPWKRIRDTAKALETAQNSLSILARGFPAPTVWQTRAECAARDVLQKLPAHATYAEKLRAAESAVRDVNVEFEYQRLCSNVVEGIVLWDATIEDKERATQAVRAAVEQLPIGSSQRELERTRELALAPFQRLIRQRKELGEKQARIDARIELSLFHIADYLRFLQSEGELEFDHPAELKDFADELQGPVRKKLQGLLRQKDLTREEIDKTIEQIVDSEID